MVRDLAIPNPKSLSLSIGFFLVSWGPNFGESIRLFFPVLCALCSTIAESNAIAWETKGRI